MDVRLIDRTGTPVETAARAAIRCTSPKATPEIVVATPCAVLSRVTASGHDSVLEHAVFTFSVDGISRVTSHQLVRHRIASFSQQSQRYVKGELGLVIPPSVLKAMDGDSYITHLFASIGSARNRLRSELEEAGVPDEDIRYLFPQGSKTSLIVTMNLRELSHFCGLRRCKRAQWEIRELADRMAMAVEAEFPTLAYLLAPQCGRLGYCPESHGCGRVPSLERKVSDAQDLAVALVLDRMRGDDADDVGEGEE